MPTPAAVTKAQLVELEKDLQTEKQGGKRITVQFNPETLKVSFSNQVASASGRRDESKPSSGESGTTGTAKMSVQLWFDVTAALPEQYAGADDVRALTSDVIYFITPPEREANAPPTAPPGVRFKWGAFQFSGVLDSIEESLEFFSNDGRPLRASVSIGIFQQQTQKVAAPAGRGGPGAVPLTAAAAGTTLQSLAAAAGLGSSWQQVAQANGIENPRLLQPGQLIAMRTR